MGMYTELHYNVELREDVPQKSSTRPKYMLDDRASQIRNARPPVVQDR